MGTRIEDLILRIRGLGGQPHHESDRRSLLHAYIACLSFTDLFVVILELLESPVDIRLALRGRLVRLLRSDTSNVHADQLTFLVEQTAARADADNRLREVVDALHSALLLHLPPPSCQQILESWLDRGTRRAMARWLKATRERPETYDASVALQYWRMTKDPRAAKSLAYQAGLEMLRRVVPELIQVCDEGWIIARAITRLGGVGDDCWDLIRTQHPATYLYLCAQLNRNVDPDEAYQLVCRCSGLALEGNRGLAIWAIGQMGMVSVLDRIQASVDEFQKQDMAALLARLPGRSK